MQFTRLADTCEIALVTVMALQKWCYFINTICCITENLIYGMHQSYLIALLVYCTPLTSNYMFMKTLVAYNYNPANFSFPKATLMFANELQINSLWISLYPSLPPAHSRWNEFYFGDLKRICFLRVDTHGLFYYLRLWFTLIWIHFFNNVLNLSWEIMHY